MARSKRARRTRRSAWRACWPAAATRRAFRTSRSSATIGTRMWRRKRYEPCAPYRRGCRGEARLRVVQIRFRIQAEPLVVWIGFPRKNQSQRPEASAMNRVCSIFSQLLQLFPRVEFQRLVQETRAERHARGFTCWGQFVAMMFCQVGQARTLREICGGLAASEGKLKHLGVSQAPQKSTLSYANQHRPWQVYQKVFETLFGRCAQIAGARQRRFRFHNPLMSIDGTLIELCSSIYDWAKWQRAKGAAKLHMVLDHDGYLPRFAVITEGKASEAAET